jgi:hypothetical protein
MIVGLLVLGAAAPAHATAPYHWTYKDYDCDLVADPGITGTLRATARIVEHGITGTSMMRIDFRLQYRKDGTWRTEAVKSVTLDAPEDGGSSALQARRGFDLGSDAGTRPHRIRFVYRWYEGEKGPITVAKKASRIGPDC